MKKGNDGLKEALDHVRKANELVIKEAEAAQGDQLKVLENVAFSLEKVDAELSDF